MKRRVPFRPMRPRRPSGRRPWRFIGLAAAVAAAAYFATLYARFPGLPQSPLLRPSEDEGQTAMAIRGNLSCAVAYINDGDTLRCQDGTRIRLHAVSARESDGTCSPGHPCPSASASAATAELRRLVAGRTIRCEQTGRSYDRITAICWTPAGQEVNCAMVRSGVALLWERFHRQRALCRTK